MSTNAFTCLTRPLLPTLDEIQHRRAQLEPAPSPIQPAAPSPHQPGPATPAQLASRNLGPAALYGVAGQFVRTLAPHTEAHPAALLLQFLAAFGNAAGPGLHCTVGSTRHRLNLFVVLVGESGRSRKGTSWNQVESLFSAVDHPWTATWTATRITTARLSAAGLVHALRDQPSPTDRRLLALSEEFASILHTLKRAKGHLSPLLRSAWDTGDLRVLDRCPVQASNTHISLIAHITERELAQHLHPTDTHNGFANRCLWTTVHRSQCLPRGDSLQPDALTPVNRQLRHALEWAAGAGHLLLSRDNAAEALWEQRYPALSQAHPGLFGSATNRAEAQVLRLSAIYAALDWSPTITVPHLEAALAVWHYCSASARDLFGTSTGDPIADRIKTAIDASDNGLSRQQIRTLFQGHVSSDRIQVALEQLLSLGVLSHHLAPGQGRRATLWSAIPAQPPAVNPDA
jgi:hypothetical protein